jgi:hypothetical protein
LPVAEGRDDELIRVVWYVEVAVGRLAGDMVVMVQSDAFGIGISGCT